MQDWVCNGVQDRVWGQVLDHWWNFTVGLSAKLCMGLSAGLGIEQMPDWGNDEQYL